MGELPRYAGELCDVCVGVCVVFLGQVRMNLKTRHVELKTQEDTEAGALSKGADFVKGQTLPRPMLYIYMHIVEFDTCSE